MDNNKLRIGIALSKDNFIWIKKLILQKYPDNFIFYHIKYDLYSKTLDSKIDVLIWDLKNTEDTGYESDKSFPQIPLIIFADDKDKTDLAAAIELHPYDIWLKGRTSNERILNSLVKLGKRKKREDDFEQFQSVIQHLPLSVVITDIKGNIKYVNRQFEKVSGYRFDELKDNNPRVLKSGVHDQDFYKNMWDTISSGAVWEREICNKNKHGELYFERLLIFPYKNRHDQIINYIGLRIDDTDHRRAEALRNIKELAGGIAHEFSQPLQVITISLNMLETKMRGNDLFARIQRMVNQIIDLVGNLKNITELKQQDYLDTKILDLKASSKKDKEIG